MQSFRAQGYEAVMVNCNPETVSTDYDTSDRLYFEPLTPEYVLPILERERPVGVVTQFGGQTPLKLAHAVEAAGFKMLGTPVEAIDLAEDRERFGRLLDELGVRCPPWGMAESGDEAVAVAERIGYPVLVRPSYVLGGRSMRVCYDESQVRAALADAHGAVLVDRFLEGALEIDVDALCDGVSVYVGAVMEHVEEAGVHSGDSSCVLPAPSLDEQTYAEVCRVVRRLGPALGVVGLLNVQLALVDGELSVLEVNPRASRTVPFASKATGVNLVDAAARLAGGARLHELALPERAAARAGQRQGGGAAVRALPRLRPGARPGDALDGRGDGERGRLRDRLREGRARRRAAAAARRHRLPVRPRGRQGGDRAGRGGFAALGFRLLATRGTAAVLADAGLAVDTVAKGDAVVDAIRAGRCDLVVNTPQGSGARRDGYRIRQAALAARVPCITTLAAARFAVDAIAHAQDEHARSLQERIERETRAA